MKRINSKMIMAFLGFAIVGILSVIGMPEVKEIIDVGAVSIVNTDFVHLSTVSLASLPSWFIMKGEVKTFKELSVVDQEALSKEELLDYLSAQKEEFKNSLKKYTDENVDKASAESLAAIKELTEKIDKTDEDFMGILKDQSKAIASLKKDLTPDEIEARKGLKAYILENSEVLKSIKANNDHSGGDFKVTLKGSQGAGDITTSADFAEMESGTIRIPVRKTSILGLFKRKKVGTEILKYREEDAVTRDAKFVIACATSTHLTKKSWIVRTVELAKIRDIIDICMDMLDDFDFVESEIRELIEESIKLKTEFELLLGASALPTDMLSIDNISSEFNPSNALADFSALTGTPFQDANLEQLADAMSAQISIFGKENSWVPNTIIMNFKDFVNYRNLKDSNGNKLHRTLSDTIATIAGLVVVTSPIVDPNTCFVFDSNQGRILDRQKLTVKTSFENKDNIEHETVTLVAVERLQFHVPLIRRNAFMKCSDIAAAIALILKP